MELKEAKNILEERKSLLINSSMPDISLFTAINTVLEELDNRIPVKKVEQLINKIKNETWYIGDGTEAKQACIEELESLLNKEK